MVSHSLMSAAILLAVVFIFAPAAQAQPAPTTVSAASFAAPVAPDSIATVFGTRLAVRTVVATDVDPDTSGVQLPTELGGTTLEVAGRRAPLFFVSPDQVNFLVPAETETGTGAVALTVRAGDGTISRGTVQVAAIAPGLFTTSGSGQGIPIGNLLRVAVNGSQTTEPLAVFNPITNNFTTRPINFGPPGERVFLVLFLTGLRGALNQRVILSVGGNDLKPSFVGPQPTLVGLDQLNVELPRSLSGRGQVDLSAAFFAQAVSNPARIEIGGAPPATLRINALSTARVLVGEELTVTGAGFAAEANDNQVFIVDDQGQGFRARLLAASATQLRVIVPFGAGSGQVIVRTPAGEVVGATRLMVRTSISGFVDTTPGSPLPGVLVRLRETGISATTNAEGRFILPDVLVRPSLDVEINPSSVPVTLPFPSVLLKVRTFDGRDRHLDRVSLQQAGGQMVSFGAGGALAVTNQTPGTGTRIERDGVVFELADGTTATFPGGATRGEVALTVLESSRVPVPLPPSVFSRTIAQLTPLGTRLTPGDRLIFPNSDNLPAGTQATLYRLDQTPGSTTLGRFVPAGTATVSADGRRLETPAAAITETSYYFAAAPRPTTMVIGRVTDSDGTTPVRQVLVRCRGQETVTDGRGEFALLGVVAVNSADLLTVEVAYQRPNGRIERVQHNGIVPVSNGVTDLTQPFVLPGETSNRPPAIIVADFLTLPETVTTTVTDVLLIAYDPDPGQTIELSLLGPNFVSLMAGNNNSFTLIFAVGLNRRGDYTLQLTATDNLGATTVRDIRLVIFVPGPQAFLAPGVSVRFGPQANSTQANPASAISVRFGAAANTTQVNPAGAVSVRFGATSTATQVNPSNAVSVLRRTASATSDAVPESLREAVENNVGVTARAAVSVSKAPTIFAVAPTQITPGRTFIITITGANLSGASALKFIGADGVPDTNLTATLIAANPEGTALSVAVTVNAEAAPGRRVVLITANAGGSPLVGSDANTIEVIR